jgi:hypothetical protein
MIRGKTQNKRVNLISKTVAALDKGSGCVGRDGPNWTTLSYWLICRSKENGQF